MKDNANIKSIILFRLGIMKFCLKGDSRFQSLLAFVVDNNISNFISGLEGKMKNFYGFVYLADIFCNFPAIPFLGKPF